MSAFTHGDPRVYRFVLTDFHIGMNPYVEGGVLTFGSCKGIIRKKCRVGDWCIAFNSKPRGGAVCCVFRVDEKIPYISYMSKSNTREDALYFPTGVGFVRKEGGRFKEYHKRGEMSDSKPKRPLIDKDRGGEFVLRSSTYATNPEDVHGSILALHHPHPSHALALPAGKTCADYEPLLLENGGHAPLTAAQAP